MKKLFKRSLAWVLALMMVVTMFSGITLVSAADAFTGNVLVESPNYYHLGFANATAENDNNYAANWGSNYRYIAQPFVPDEAVVGGVEVGVLITSGTATIEVEIRSGSVNGEVVGKTTQQIHNTGNTNKMLEIDFKNDVTVTPGEVYYLVYWLSARSKGSTALAAFSAPKGVAGEGKAHVKLMSNEETEWVESGVVACFKLLGANGWNEIIHDLDTREGVVIAAGNVGTNSTQGATNTEYVTQGSGSHFSNWGAVEVGATGKMYLSLTSLQNRDLTNAKYLTIDVYVHGFEVNSASTGVPSFYFGSGTKWNSFDKLDQKAPALKTLKEGWNNLTISLDTGWKADDKTGINNVCFAYDAGGTAITFTAADPFVIFDNMRVMDEDGKVYAEGGTPDVTPEPEQPKAEAFTKYDAAMGVLYHIGFSNATADNDSNYTNNWGKNYRYFAQEFVPEEAVVGGVKLGMLITSGLATIDVEIRKETPDGELVAATRQPILSTNNQFRWVEVDFKEDVDVTPGAVYCMVYWLSYRDKGSTCIGAGGQKTGASNERPLHIKLMGDDSATWVETISVASFELIGANGWNELIHPLDNDYGVVIPAGNLSGSSDTNGTTVEEGMNQGYGANKSHWGTVEVGATNKLFIGSIAVQNRDWTKAKYLAFDMYAYGFKWHEGSSALPMVYLGNETGWASSNLFGRASEELTSIQEGWNTYYIPLEDSCWKTEDRSGVTVLSIRWDNGSKALIEFTATDAYVLFDNIRVLDENGKAYAEGDTSGDTPTPEPTPEPLPDWAFVEFSETDGLIPYHVALSTATSSDINWSNYRFMAQEIVPYEENLSGAKLYMRLTGGTAKVHMELRKDVNGVALASNDCTITSVGNVNEWYEISLEKNVVVTPGETYYLVWWLTERTESVVCLSYFKDCGAGGAVHPGHLQKLADTTDGLVDDLSAGPKNHLFAFQLITEELEGAPTITPTPDPGPQPEPPVSTDAAKAVNESIAALPTVDSEIFTADVAAVRAAYEALSAEEKENVTDLAKLEAAEKALADLTAIKVGSISAGGLAESVASFGTAYGELLGWKIDAGQNNNWIVYNMNNTYGAGDYKLGIKVKYTGLGDKRPALSLKCADRTTGEDERFKWDIGGEEYDAAVKDEKGFATFYLDVSLDAAIASHKLEGMIFAYNEFHENMEIIVDSVFWVDANDTTKYYKYIDKTDFPLASVAKVLKGSLTYDEQNPIRIEYVEDESKPVDDEPGYIFTGIDAGKQNAGEYKLDLAYVTDEGNDTIFEIEVYADGSKVANKMVTEQDFAKCSKNTDGLGSLQMTYTLEKAAEVEFKVYQFNGGSVSYRNINVYQLEEFAVSPVETPLEQFIALAGQVAVSDVTEEHRAIIEAAKIAYDNMSDDEKALVAEDVVTKLADYMAALEALTPADIPYGDVSGDDAIDAKDALMILQAAVDKLELTDEQILIADVNGDQEIDAKDALLVLQKAVDKIEKFPVEA